MKLHLSILRALAPLVMLPSISALAEVNSPLIQSSTIGLGTNTTPKGIAIRLGTDHKAAACFDTELLRFSGAWTGGFVSPVKLMSRGEYPTNMGPLIFTTPSQPGWSSGTNIVDTRPRPIGPLPSAQAKYLGFYLHDAWTILHYTVGQSEVFDLPDYESLEGIFTRSFNIAPSATPLTLLVCEAPPHPGQRAVLERVGNGQNGYIVLPAGTNTLAVGLQGAPKETAWEVKDGRLFLKLPELKSAAKFRLAIWQGDNEEPLEKFIGWVRTSTVFSDPKVYTKGGPAHWPESVVTRGELGKDTAAYTVDTLTVPYDNPWKSEMLLAGLDFFADGRRAAVCTFHGDVWIVSGIDAALGKLTWKRYAAGLYHALGLKIVNDEVYVLGRDQITHLHDFNHDGEADYYENFNNDCLVTPNFHEFAFDLQTDKEGSFYFTKAGPVRNGGRGFEEILDHHGSLFKVSPDGKKFEVVATGFRAPNGIGVGPDGELTSGDNEGTWTPACRLNWIKPGGFYGCVPTSHRTPPPIGYDKPLCWLPKSVDNSSGGQVWVANDQWGPFTGHLLHLSYGTCSLFHVLKEEVDGQVQGGVVRFPLNFNSGIMRARFNPGDNQLYLVGMKGWQTSAAKNGGFQRVRHTGRPVCLPLEMRVKANGIQITFTTPLEKAGTQDLENFALEEWNYIWSGAYGSPEISPKAPAPQPGENGTEWDKNQSSLKQHDPVALKSATLSADGKTLFLEIPGLKPVMQMKIKYNLRAADGTPVTQEIFNTINTVPAAG